MPTVRLPLNFPIQSRKADPFKDSKMVNAYTEDKEVLKRPGLGAFSTNPVLPVNTGQGVFAYNNDLYTCTNNSVYKVTTAGVTTNIGTISGALKPISWTSTFNNNYLFFHNQTNGYYYSNSTGLHQLNSEELAQINVSIPGSGYLNPTLWTESSAVTLYEILYYGTNVYMVTVIGTTGTTAPTFTSGTATDGTATLAYIGTTTSIVPSVSFSSGSATATAIVDPSSASIMSITLDTKGSGYTSVPTVTIGLAWAPSTAYAIGTQIYSNGNLYTVVTAGTTGTTAPTHTAGVVTNGSADLLYAGIKATATAILNYFPSDLTPGIAYLDTYVAIMTTEGRIYTSNVGDPTTWNALNYISSNSQPDKATGIISHLNYVVAFNAWSTQFFYDAGTSTGSPLLPNASANLEIGCANGNSIAKFEQTVIWVGQSNTAGKGIYLLNGISPNKISNQYIDKYLDADGVTNCTAYGIKYNGHSWYILTLPDIDVTFVFDLDEKVWTFWSSVLNNTEQYFIADFATSLAGHTYLQDSVNGELYKLDQNTYTDADGVINFRLVSPLLDADTQYRKTISRVEIIGDKVDTVLRIRHTDNDYQNWSMYRNVNLIDTRPVLFQNGITRRRAYELFNNDNAFIRLAFMEMDITLGDN